MDELEMSVIGGLIGCDDDSYIEKAFSQLSAECFVTEELSKLYLELREQYRTFGKIDVVLASKNLGAGYKKIMVECMQLVPSPRTLPQYTDKLFEVYRKRVLLKDISNIKDDLTINAPLSEIMQTVSNMVTTQNKLDEVQDCSTSLDFLDSVIEFINSLGVKNKSYKTGLQLLDYVLGGFQPKSVSVIAGRSGMGKTDIAIFLATRLAISGTRVLYLTMEMPRTQIMGRITSRVSRIDSTKIRDGNLSDNEKALINISLDKICKIPLIFDEQQNLSVYDISSKIKKHKPQVVFIDHLGLMALDKYKKRWESISDNSVALKKLAMETGVAIVELVQQNSEAEKRADKTANLSDLKGSDGIGNDADTVMFIRADKSGKGDILTGDESVKAYLQIEKNRSGKTGTIGFNWQPQYHTYTMIDSRGN